MPSAPMPPAPELSVRAVALGGALSAVLAASNAYLGLFAGMTVSAAIPAAVVSMGILRSLRGGLLENNIVQTAASAGESVAAGAIFTLPALILLGAWTEFDYWWTVALLGSGGLLGVVFTIPLRRALIVGTELPFPEGVATAEVLKTGHGQGGARGFRVLLGGAAIGSLAKLFESGLGVLRATLEAGTLVGGRVLVVGCGASPALMAVGYIVGFNVAALIAAGGVINWLLVVPFTAHVTAGQSALEAGWNAWSQQTRYLGVGAMTVGGLGAVIQLRGKMWTAARELLAAVQPGEQAVAESPLERDLAGSVLLWILTGSLLTLGIVFSAILGFGLPALLLVGLVLVTGFVFCAVAAYMAGLVGSSNNPVSGVTIATLLITSVTLLALGLRKEAVAGSFAGPAAAILVGTAVCTAAAIGGDTMQDLKAGRILGAHPGKQQIAQIVGVIAAALVLAPVLQLLLDVHGFGAPDGEHLKPLRAPQATLMAAVANGVFGGQLPLGFVLGGALLGLAFFGLDWVLMKRQAPFRAPPLALAVGLYLPLELSLPIALGGAIAWLVERARSRRGQGGADAERLGLLLGAGLITGEALLGIGLAAWAGATGSLDGLRVSQTPSAIATFVLLAGVAAAFYAVGTKSAAVVGPGSGP